jgi:titin
VTGTTTKTGNGTTSPITVSSLTNSKAYSCTVKATNAKGSSVASGAVSVTPKSTTITVPGAPTIGAATVGNAQITVAFTASTSGGTAATFTATCGTKTASGTASPLVVTGLTNGTAYTCTVTATNTSGTSVASGAVSVTPESTTITVPGAPTISKVDGATGGVLIYFSAASSGGTPSYYKAACTASGTTTAISSNNFSASPIWLSGLTSGIAYSCTVLAGNSSGVSSSSTAVTGTPTTASNALVTPSVKGVLPGDGRISVQFNYIGGKVTTQITASTYTPASGYIAVCTSSDGGVSNTSLGSAEYSAGKANVTNPLVVSGLTNGKTYTCSVGGYILVSSKYYLAASTASSSTIPNAGPSNATGVLASTANTSHITTYPAYSSYCGYTNQTATGTGAVPRITYSTSSTATTTGTSTAAFTCTSTTTRTLTGNALPDHLASEFFTNGLSPYTGNPYFSGNPNKIGTSSISKAMPYSGTISTKYTMGASGYDTSSCYSYTTASSPSNTNATFTSGSTYRCKFVSYNYANNSVLIEPGTAETYTGTSNTIYKVVGKNLYQDVGLDPSNAHNQPTMSGDSMLMYGNYHYHGVPEGHVARIGKGNSTMTLVAFAADGFPIYARYGYSTRTSSTSGVKVMKSNYRLRTAAELITAGYTDRPSTALAPYGTFEQDWVFDAATAGGDLDACNGRYGVTPESPNTAVYHYFITDSYPFVQRCVFGQNPASWANRN